MNEIKKTRLVLCLQGYIIVYLNKGVNMITKMEKQDLREHGEEEASHNSSNAKNQIILDLIEKLNMSIGYLESLDSPNREFIALLQSSIDKASK